MTPAAVSGTMKEPGVTISIAPVKVLITIPARLEAKFWMPPIPKADHAHCDFRVFLDKNAVARLIHQAYERRNSGQREYALV